MSRTPQEVFDHHGQALVAGDLDAIVSDYADDAVFITPDGVLRGKEGVRQAFEKLLSDPSVVAKVVSEAVTVPHPKAIYTAPRLARILTRVRKLMGSERLRDLAERQFLGIPRKM